ncbi:MAG TPA: methyltransferase domain-containing protein, partial [Solirubrobacterales bacterium]|nr:methyltransferase domain-containing protein [Solirubrobacterales bacterium]
MLRNLRRRLIERTLERGGETRERVTMAELGIDQEEYHEYEPSGWKALSSAMRGVEIGPDDGFLDIGCGKGRVLQQASRRPFARVVGVELSPQLAEQARRLIAATEHRRCGSLEV